MSTLEQDVLGRFLRLPDSHQGPVTAARKRRNHLVYAGIALLAYVPVFLGLPAGWQAAGLGLLLPGAGFLAVGGWALLGLPLTLAAAWLSCIAWFWAGNVMAPLAVWLGSALVAGFLAGDSVWAPAPWLAPLAAAGTWYYFYRWEQQRRAADRERFVARQGFYADSRAEVETRAEVEPAAGTRELDLAQLGAVRYSLNRALQPIGEFRGYTIIDQFQPAALRYQINHLCYGLSLAQAHYTPNFSGYLSLAQRNLIETYLCPRVWDYWVLESMWGHFNFSNFDPAAKDNVMLTGYYGMQVNAYMLASGDQRYAEPGSLTFRLNERTAYPHDAHTIAKSVLDNFNRSDFCLFPCEPNWVYPVCNMYGMAALASHDAVFGSRHTPSVLPRWMNSLEREFTDEKGSIVGLRSYWTGHDVGIFNSEAGFAFYANISSPALGRRLWAVGRKELSFCIADDGHGRPRLSFPPAALTFLDTIDVGHYKKGMLFAYAAVAMSAREFGDDELAEAALHAMDLDCGLQNIDGAATYTTGSGLANAWSVEARIMRTGDYHSTFTRGPAAETRNGPLLAEASYPDVLVAKAYSRGEDLELVLHPGGAGGRQRIGLARLKPGQSYALRGADAQEVFRADARGEAQLDVELHGRTALHVVPVSG